jgi:hypothetical protein
VIDGDEVLRIIGEKGWSLYEDIHGSTMPPIISRGRATTIRQDLPYHLVPYAHWDSDVNTVYFQVERTRATNQVPSYLHEGERLTVRGLVMREEDLVLLLSPNQNVIEIAAADVADCLKHNLSNFNTFFFESIADVKKSCADRGMTPQRPSPLPGQIRWEWVHQDRDPSVRVIYPSDASPILFRGQTRRYRPCFPTLGRSIQTKTRDLDDLTPSERIAIFVNRVRSEWFVECVRHTPPFLWMTEQRIWIDELAVAQHYGLTTQYIDLTQSLDVASFFACCRYDAATREWLPMSDGEGVIYAIDRTLTVPDPEGDTLPCKPINLQPFPRPSEQWGWTYEAKLGEDFDSAPHVWRFLFRHDVGLSQAILNHFDGGKALFPPDPTADLAERIVRTNVLPLTLATAVAATLLPGPANDDALIAAFVAEASRHGGVTFATGVPDPLDKALREELERVWQARSPEFLQQGIGMRLVRTRRVPASDAKRG